LYDLLRLVLRYLHAMHLPHTSRRALCARRGIESRYDSRRECLNQNQLKQKPDTPKHTPLNYRRCAV